LRMCWPSKEEKEKTALLEEDNKRQLALRATYKRQFNRNVSTCSCCHLEEILLRSSNKGGKSCG
jgi:hypothetical protein